MNQYLVKDYMRSDVIDIKENATIKEAISLMINKKTNALVVTDAERHVTGIITSWGIIEAVVPDYLEQDKKLASFESGHMFEKRVKDMSEQLVKDVMSTEVHVIKPEDSLMNTTTQISQFHIRQLPVVNDDRVLVGYINHTDIKRAMGDVLNLTS